jgi:hypothetical protein
VSKEKIGEEEIENLVVARIDIIFFMNISFVGYRFA